MAAVFGGHEMLAKLGQGGMGAVYKARQPSADRIVALKVMNPGTATEAAFARFEREMKIVGRLRHPNIVRLFTVGREKNRVFFTMDFIDGKPLSQFIAEAKTDEDRKTLVKHLAAVARAIHYAHTEKVIHRDLKPSNIIVDQQGNPVVTDFGLAKELGAGQTVTITGEAIGTVNYMSPEQAQGEKDIGPASDVFSLGVILYEILTGKPPFEGSTPTAVLQKLLQEEPIPPRTLNSAISKDLQAICLKCLAKQPQDRYTTAEALAQDVELSLAGKAPSGAKVPSIASVLRAHPITAAAIVGGIVVAIAATIGLAGLFRHSTPAALPVSSGIEVAPGSISESRPSAVHPLPNTIKPAPVDTTSRSGQGGIEPFETTPANSLTMTAKVESFCDITVVHCIAADDREVWWGTTGGAFQLDIASGETTFFPCAWVTSIYRGADGDWWFGTQDGVYRFRAGHLERALRAERIVAVGGDGRGSIWFAGGNGVYCFDGTTWRRYTREESFPGNIARATIADRQGRLWILMDRALYCFDGKAWKSYARGDDFAGKELYNWVAADDPQGRLWFAASRGGVVSFDGANWKTYTQKDGLTDVEVIHALGADSQGRMWAGTLNGLFFFDGAAWKPCTQKGAPSGHGVDFVAADPKGRMWFGSLFGLSCLDGNTWTNYKTMGGLPPQIYSMAGDARGRLWFGTLYGVACFDGKTWTPWKPPQRKERLTFDFLRIMASDQKGRMWFGTTGSLSCFDGRDWKTYNKPYVNRIASDGQGRIWFGTEMNGAYCFDGAEWKTYTSSNGVASNWVRALAADRQGRMWIGTDDGVCCFDAGVWTTYTKNDGLASNRCTLIVPDSQGRIWVSSDGRLSSFDGTTWKAHGQKDGLPSDYIRVLAPDQKGRMWVTNGFGVSCFDGVTWKNYTREDGLADNQVISLAADPQGRMWITTMRGASCFDGTGWKTYTRKDGLASDFVKLIHVDRQGRVWFVLSIINGSEGGGVSCFDGTTWKTYTQKDGLASDNISAVAADREGRTWFGTTGGVSCFDGKAWHSWTAEDFPGLEDVRSLTVAGDGSIWLTGASGVSHIVLKDDKP